MRERAPYALYADDKDTLAASLDRTQHTSTRIISAILEDANTDARP